MRPAGVGTSQHVYGELFKAMTGVNMIHMPYRGDGPAMADLLAGHVPLMFETDGTGIGHVREGRLRALAVTAATRTPTLPDPPLVGRPRCGRVRLKR